MDSPAADSPVGVSPVVEVVASLVGLAGSEAEHAVRAAAATAAATSEKFLFMSRR